MYLINFIKKNKSFPITSKEKTNISMSRGINGFGYTCLEEKNNVSQLHGMYRSLFQEGATPALS